MIGKNIKKIRLNNNLTLQELAEESGLTRSLISQIENGKANPSINTLKKLARNLHVPIGSFFNEDNDHSIVVKYENRKILKTRSGITYYLLNPTLKNTNIEFLYVIYEKDASTGTRYSHQGEEIGVVLKGKLKIIVEKEEYILNKGDSIKIDSSLPHKIINIYNGDTEAHWVNSPPTF
jgi:transcriptional regulator with XRE-family HTH domain